MNVYKAEDFHDISIPERQYDPERQIIVYK